MAFHNTRRGLRLKMREVWWDFGVKGVFFSGSFIDEGDKEAEVLFLFWGQDISSKKRKAYLGIVSLV